MVAALWAETKTLRFLVFTFKVLCSGHPSSFWCSPAPQTHFRCMYVFFLCGIVFFSVLLHVSFGSFLMFIFFLLLSPTYRFSTIIITINKHVQQLPFSDWSVGGANFWRNTAPKSLSTSHVVSLAILNHHTAVASFISDKSTSVRWGAGFSDEADIKCSRLTS